MTMGYLKFLILGDSGNYKKVGPVNKMALYFVISVMSLFYHWTLNYKLTNLSASDLDLINFEKCLLILPIHFSIARVTSPVLQFCI